MEKKFNDILNEYLFNCSNTDEMQIIISGVIMELNEEIEKLSKCTDTYWSARLAKYDLFNFKVFCERKLHNLQS